MYETMTLTYVLCHLDRLRTHLTVDTDDAASLRGDRGAMTTETVIIVAGLAALALAVVAIIVAKVTDKANSIPTT